jgi:tetratricopeptide (TPR) repeat protein
MVALWVGLVGILIAALYGQFLQNPILFDDLYLFLQGKDGHVAIEQYASPSLLDLRALPYATLAWTAKRFGYGLMSFRIENMLLHWLVVIAAALFVLRLYRTVLPVQQSERTSMTTAVLIVVSLFAVHPLNVYAAGYLVQRTIVMATIFSLLSLWAYLQGVNGKKSWLWASVALYFTATHSKEHVIMLPAVMVVLTVLVHDDWRSFIRRNWPVFLGYIAIGLLTIAQIRGVLGHPYEINSGEMLEGLLPEHAFFYSVLTQTWLFFKYGLLWLLPNPAWHSVDMREPLAQGIFSLYGLALLAYLFYGFVAFRLLFRRGAQGLIGFALLFPWLLFATEFSTVRIQEIFVLYRSYLWAMGGVIVLPLLLMQLNARLTLMVSVLVAAVMFMMSMERLATFSHPILLWQDAEKLVTDRQSLPGVGRIYYNRGTEWLKIDNLSKAQSDLQTATRLSPNLSAGFGNLGQVYSRTGQNDQAIQAFSRAIALDQEQKAAPNYKLYYSRAIVYEAQHKFFEASIDYQVSCLLANKGCDKLKK